ncbi:Type I restriction-modification system, M subunit (fragment) [Methylocella tundrae]
MRPNGKAACILPHGALSRGNAETEIRKALVKSGYLKGIIGLPPNLFYGTSIPACIIVLDKENAAARRGIFMVDASKGFRRDGAKNRLREQDMHRIVDTFTRANDVPGYARMVPHDEIAADGNSYSLSLRRYIDSSEAEDIQDIDAHLNGGIPVRDIDALAAWWKVMPSLRGQLFADLRPGYLSLTLPVEEVKAAIEDHSEFQAFTRAAGDVLAAWRTRTDATARAFGLNGHPREFIEAVSEDLLEAFRKAPLVDAYDVYQHLMDYWAEAMQDDAYLIAAVGWAAGAAPREIVKRKNKEGKLVWPEPGDYQIGKRRFTSDLVPSRLIIARHFAVDQAAIDALDARLAELEQEMAYKLEDGAGEDGLLTEVIEGEGEKQKITAKAIKARLKEIGRDADLADEREALLAYQALIDDFDEARKKRKAAEEKLYAKVHARYAAFTDDEVKELVAGDKWLATIEARVVSEVSRAAQLLTARTRLLAERYSEPLPRLKDDVARLDGRVTTHRQLLRGQKRLVGFSDQWREVSFFEAVSIVSGQVDPKNEPYRSMVLIGSEHIESGTGMILSLKSAAEQGAISGKYLFRRGDILYGKINPHLKKVAIAPFDGICSADIYPLRPRHGYSSRFLLSVLLAKEFTEFSVSLSARSGIPKINREELAGFRFRVPDEVEQESIALVLNDIDEELATLEKHISKLRAVAQAATQALLSSQRIQFNSNTSEVVERGTPNA